MADSDRRPTGRRRVRLSQEERRAQIVRAAVKLFAERGYARTTTRDIAREAGISEGTIYRHFTSKQDLLSSFIESTALQSLQAQFAARQGSDDEREMLQHLFEERFALAERHRALMKVAIGEALFDPELARAIAKRIAGPAIALLQSFVGERIRRGRFRETDPEIVSRAMVGTFMAFAVLWPALLPKAKRKHSPQQLAETLASFFLDGLRAPAERKESAT